MNDILEYKTYYATVHFSGEDEVFHGKIIGINDTYLRFVPCMLPFALSLISSLLASDTTFHLHSPPVNVAVLV